METGGPGFGDEACAFSESRVETENIVPGWEFSRVLQFVSFASVRVLQATDLC